VVHARGFDAGFFTLSAIAALALLFYWWAVPETGGVSRREPSTCRSEESGMARGLAREIVSAP